MMNFCTLFDSLYLSKGLIMYESIKENTDDFHLFVFAFDDICLKILEYLDLPNVTVISLKKFENEQLISVKDKRTKAEYCWTCTPSIINFVLENYRKNQQPKNLSLSLNTVFHDLQRCQKKDEQGDFVFNSLPSIM